MSGNERQRAVTTGNGEGAEDDGDDEDDGGDGCNEDEGGEDDEGDGGDDDDKGRRLNEKRRRRRRTPSKTKGENDDDDDNDDERWRAYGAYVYHNFASVIYHLRLVYGCVPSRAGAAPERCGSGAWAALERRRRAVEAAPEGRPSNTRAAFVWHRIATTPSTERAPTFARPRTTTKT